MLVCVFVCVCVRVCVRVCVLVCACACARVCVIFHGFLKRCSETVCPISPKFGEEVEWGGGQQLRGKFRR